MKRMLTTVLLAAAVLLFAGGCAKLAATPTPHPDTQALQGLWEQFIPVGGMPVEVLLDGGGDALLDGSPARWRVDGGKLLAARGGEQTAYGYTVSGYLLTLYDTDTDTSCFYINPDAFASGADGNAAFAGRWAAWSSWGVLAFDGNGGLDNILYTTAGRTQVRQQYAARDGILQTSDESGNYTYNLYSFDENGTLLLAETADYDSENKQWTSYWKKTDAGPVAGQWTRAVDGSPGGTGLPERLTLSAGGTGSAAEAGQPARGISWERYGEFLILAYTDTDMAYAWCAADAGVLYLGNPDLDECWYIDGRLYRPAAGGLGPLAGLWEAEDGGTALEFRADGTAAARWAGKETPFTARAAGGLLSLDYGGVTYYAAYALQDDELRLYYGQLPFLEQKDLPAVFRRSR